MLLKLVGSLTSSKQGDKVVTHASVNADGLRCAIVAKSGRLALHDLSSQSTNWLSSDCEYSICNFCLSKRCDFLLANVAGRRREKLCCLDLRASENTPVMKFNDDRLLNKVSFSSVTLDDRILVAGSDTLNEASVNDDPQSLLLFWDVRMPSQSCGCFNECHSDDITSLNLVDDYLFSASTDGLLNAFDLNASNEEDSLLCTYNCEAPVDRVYIRQNCNEETSCGQGLILTTESLQGDINVVSFSHNEFDQIFHVKGSELKQALLAKYLKSEDDFCSLLATDLSCGMQPKLRVLEMCNESGQLYGLEYPVTGGRSSKLVRCLELPQQRNWSPVYAWNCSKIAQGSDDTGTNILIAGDNGQLVSNIIPT